jgi:flagellar protein FlgJ
MKDFALESSRATGIPARFLLGQAALESGWGRHEIRGADGKPSYNVFGIKAGRGWSGPSVDAVTTEYVNGAAQRVVQKFRAYGSYGEAFQDYARLIRANPRYAALLGAQDGAGFARGMQRAGYATDPQYAYKLIGVMNRASIQKMV